MPKFAEFGHFRADFDPLQNMFLAPKFEPLDQTKQHFQFNKHKKFLTNDEKDNSMQHHLGCKKWQKTWCKLYLKWPIGDFKVEKHPHMGFINEMVDDLFEVFFIISIFTLPAKNFHT